MRPAESTTTNARIREHGYGLLDSGQELIAFVNPTESEVIETFRAGVESERNGCHECVVKAEVPFDLGKSEFADALISRKEGHLSRAIVACRRANSCHV